MELNAVDERVLVNRGGVGRAPAQRLEVRLTGLSDVLRGDRGEPDELDVDLDLTGADPVADAPSNLRTGPQADRKGDVSG